MTINTLTQTVSPTHSFGANYQPRRSVRHHSYYRFRTYTASAGSNQLVIAATPLFTLMMVLQYTQYAANATPLHQQIVHEINAFESAALAQGYSDEFVMVARYALCAAVDETMRITQWGQQQQWDQCNLLSTFQQTLSTNDCFVSILDQLRDDPKHYIDILEIMYLCLSLGFESRYREQHHDKIEQLIDELYRLICSQRGRIKKRLSVCKHFTKQVIKKPRGISLWRSLITGSMLIGILYTVFTYTTFTITQPLTHTLQQLTVHTKIAQSN